MSSFVYHCLFLFRSLSVSYNHVVQLFYGDGNHTEHQVTPYFPVSFDSDMPCAIVVFQIRVSPFHCGTLTVSALFRRSKRNVFSSAFVAVYDRNMPQLTGEIPDFTCIISGIRQIIKNRCTLLIKNF